MTSQSFNPQSSADAFHIRRPLRAAGGTQFYRDKSDRGNGTFCGATETAYDVQHNAKVVAFNGRRPCSACVTARSATNG